MDRDQLVGELERVIPKEAIVSDPDLLEKYGHDETPDLYREPLLVVRPKTTGEISSIMAFANREGIPVVPRGGGTGLAGGAVPPEGSIVISTERMDRIMEIDPVNMVAVVQAGVITGKLAEAVEKEGLFYPPDPASLDACTIGGNIATGAGGANTLRFGTTKDYLLGLTTVLADGRVLRLGGKNVKDATGYKLIPLFCGSEGTLGIITEAILRLLPLPRKRIDLLLPFPDLHLAVGCAVSILRADIVPTALEMMEERAISYVETYLKKKFPFPKAPVLLLIRVDGDDEKALMEKAERISDLAEGAIDCFVAQSPSEQRRVWEARRAISDALKSKGKLYHEDIVVPRGRIPDFVPSIHELGQNYNLEVILYGHLGDGNIHINLIEPDPERLSLFRCDLYRRAKELGGRISGEHGIGLIKRDYLNYCLDPEVIETMRVIKEALDPKGILNPGKVLFFDQDKTNGRF
ncbi:hypothetical protein DRP53_07415 [candidate division WOR-3 bacterium]|uniref:FAD-binding PCMH-type domain-containing protein n=1 Tax=candidate division WOR-3 bacterium TaxID=2052148 RepID=A0A660SIA5_UNCW3|nr:MAG: hypothetical protein DRP53_07415 [candidate division WOR-3 bacterium]